MTDVPATPPLRERLLLTAEMTFERARHPKARIDVCCADKLRRLAERLAELAEELDDEERNA